MNISTSDDAWNNFVMHGDPSAFDAGCIKRSAAIANLYMGLANNGGINSFLTDSYELDASEVHDALKSIGALKAAEQFSNVLSRLGCQLPAASQDARWDVLEERWTEDLDEFDVLTSEADQELMMMLEKHVSEHEDFYLALRPEPEN